MSFSLGDDGTLDTVIVCDDCDAELRYNFQGGDLDNLNEDGSPEHAYDFFVSWAKDDAAETHECENS